MAVSPAVGAALSCGLMSVLSFSGALLLLLGKKGGAGWAEYAALTLAASTMVADSFLHLLPEAVEDGNEWTMLAAFLGAVSVVCFEAGCAAVESSVEPFGLANLAVEAVHNLIDGAAIGVSWAASTSAGLATTVAVAIHELPQELGDFAVLKRAGFDSRRLLLANFAVSLTSFLGVALASTLVVSHYLLAFTAGSFLALSLHSIAPQVLASLDEHKASPFARVSCLAIALAAALFMHALALLEHADGHHHDHHHHHAEL
mmetsp:Transcript_2767/g.8720  ORF Transcript_2767/g.8720 Transcript_2767/m.8720 type:complete len:259 (-) Transcript_2767:61-837(-)